MCVKVSLSNGADINATDEFGNGALILAALNLQTLRVGL